MERRKTGDESKGSRRRNTARRGGRGRVEDGRRHGAGDGALEGAVRELIREAERRGRGGARDPDRR